MIWVAAFRTLTVLNLTIGPRLTDAGPVLRTLVLATTAVPVVIYGMMPQLHRARASLLARLADRLRDTVVASRSTGVYRGARSDTIARALLNRTRRRRPPAAMAALRTLADLLPSDSAAANLSPGRLAPITAGPLDSPGSWRSGTGSLSH